MLEQTEQLNQLKAALADRYHIERELGRGGMATVYLAQDLRHERRVAIKVLRPELAAAVGRDRFLREIKLTAQLNHPHILPLLDSGAADGFLYYVMPYVQGESLRDRLTREQQLPVEDALQIVGEVADALDYAHRHDVVHRDIKPENILLDERHAVVADFGIGRAITAAGGEQLTATGAAVGTPAYMSPEQAAGSTELDGRSDLYSLGCVLYEMLAGQPPFTGPTLESVMHQHLAVAPPAITHLRPAVPAEVARTLARALAKVPADRFATLHQFAEALGWGGRATTGGVGRRLAVVAVGVRLVRGVLQRPRVAWAVAGGLAITALGLGLARGGGAAAPAGVVRFTIRLPPEQRLYIFFRISRDGRTIVLPVQEGLGGLPGYVGGSSNLQLVLRPLAAVAPRRVVDITGAPGSGLAISPDGAWVVYCMSTRLWKVATSGDAAPIELAEVTSTFCTPDWSPGDTIVYHQNGGLWMVSAAGGDARQVSAPDSLRGEMHWWPQVLPDGRGVLFTAYAGAIERARIEVLHPETGERRLLVEGAIFGRYVPSGHLLFVRGHTLFAMLFDLGRLEARGQPVQMLDDLATRPGTGGAGFDVSETGTLVYIRQSVWAERNRLVWVDRTGRVTPVLDRLGQFATPRLSPDGRRLAVMESDDVWVYELTRDVFTRLTRHPGLTFSPLWTPDGSRVIYSAETPQWDIFWRAADGSTPPETLLTTRYDKLPRSVTPDGRFLFYAERDLLFDTFDLWMLALDGSGERRRLTESPYHEWGPAVSPDGAWLAYASNESGRYEVYVTALPDGRGRTQVSLAGGYEPVWTRSGREILYRHGDRVLSVRFDRTSGEFSRPQELFVGPFAYAFPGPSFDVSADAQRLLMVQTPPELLPREVEVVLNWFEELKAKVGR